MFTEEDIIYTYSRKQAIEDGLQVLMDQQMSREAGIVYPVYFTNGVVELIQKAVDNKKYCNDFNGVTWDIYTMFRYAARQAKNSSLYFQVIITGVGRKRYIVFLAEIGATDFDNPEPAITIMLPEER